MKQDSYMYGYEEIRHRLHGHAGCYRLFFNVDMIYKTDTTIGFTACLMKMVDESPVIDMPWIQGI